MGSQHLRIPYGYLRQLCYPGGQRLDARVNRIPPAEGDMEVVPIPISYSPSSRSVVTDTTLEIVRPMYVGTPGFKQMGNLGNEMYRYFMGSDEQSLFYTCRGCLIPEGSKAASTRHFDNCRRLCNAIEMRVSREQTCVICNTSTQRKCWNLYLCSDLCIIKWRFSIPNSWLIARRFVLASEPSLLKLRPSPMPKGEIVHETLH